MFGLGIFELLILLLIVFVIFGAGKLPQLGEAIGKGIKNFKKATEEPSAKVETASVEKKQIEQKSNSTVETG